MNFLKNIKKASVETDFLMYVFISLTVISLVISIFKVVSFTKFFDEFIQDEIRIRQLKRNLFISNSHKIENNNKLVFRYKMEDFFLEHKNNRLILSPGTIVVLENIDNVYFYKGGENYFLKYCRNIKCKEVIIYEE